ncbi:MAG: hypothetical protein ACRERD_16155, partial [Candidatus Binatia bacterium]
PLTLTFSPLRGANDTTVFGQWENRPFFLSPLVGESEREGALDRACTVTHPLPGPLPSRERGKKAVLRLGGKSVVY